MGQFLRTAKFPILTFFTLMVLISILSRPSLISAQTAVFEFDAVVSVEGWNEPFDGSDSTLGFVYLWVKSNDRWFGPSRILNDGSSAQRIQVDLEKLPGIRQEFEFYVSATDETPSNQRLLFRANGYRVTGEAVPEPGISYVVKVEVSFNNPDDDGDGIPSFDEAFMLWHTDINEQFVLVSSDPFNQDTDRDGILDGPELRGVNEWACRTSPRLVDSDGDGLTDIQEVRTNPCRDDTDGDGLLDADELKHGTDPLNPDTDRDGLNDGLEVLSYNTDPLNPDTDGDGLTDGPEALRYHTNPLSLDSDADGLGDAEEVLTYNTNPISPDSDADELEDAEEIERYHTHPLNPDSDGDGLKDGEEVLRFNTDPLNPDSNGDGFKDGEEVVVNTAGPLSPDADGFDYYGNRLVLIIIGIGVIGAIGIGYLGFILFKVSSTATRIETQYGYSPGDSLGEVTDEFNRLSIWPLAQRLYRIRWHIR